VQEVVADRVSRRDRAECQAAHAPKQPAPPERLRPQTDQYGSQRQGEGSIYEYPKGSGRWFAQVYLEDGRSIRRRADSQREAREKRRQIQAGGRLPTPPFCDAIAMTISSL